MPRLKQFAAHHPRLDVVAIITAHSGLDAMRLLMNRDLSWGDMGINEAVYLGPAKPDAKPSFSFWGQEDCEGHPANISDVIALIQQRRKSPACAQRFRAMLSAILPKG